MAEARLRVVEARLEVVAQEFVPAGQRLQWLRHRDEMTRGKAIILARNGMPFGEALKAAVWRLSITSGMFNYGMENVTLLSGSTLLCDPPSIT